MKAASERLGVPADELVAKDGTIAVKADPSKSVTYGDLIGGKKFNIPLSPTAKRRPASEWTVLGKPVPRIDLPALVTAQFQFVHNVRVPGMLHGRVVRPAAVGATLVGVDESSLAGLPGVVKVVVKKNFVGVVAEKPWQAVQAARRLKARWTPGWVCRPRRTSTSSCGTRSRRATPSWSTRRTWTRRSPVRRPWSRPPTFIPIRVTGRLAHRAPSLMCRGTGSRSGRRLRACIRSNTRWRSSSACRRRTFAWCSCAARAATASTGRTPSRSTPR